MKFISWNIDGINAALENKSNRGKLSYGVLEDIANLDPDAICIQETKLSKLTEQHLKVLASLYPGYTIKHNMSGERKGYAGTLTLFKDQRLENNDLPSSATEVILPSGKELINTNELDKRLNEGRITALEFDDFYLVNVYTINSGGSELLSLEERILWDEYFKALLIKLNEDKVVIACGDFNVAHRPIDLKNPSANSLRAGYTVEERNGFTSLLNSGFVDTFRQKNGDIKGAYSWFTQLSKTAKANNSGWRIDYFIVSESIKDNIVKAEILDSGERKDHSPILLEIK